MTRKDYVALAAALANARPDDNSPGNEAWTTWKACVRSVADALAHDNPRFGRAKFYDAAEGLS